MDVSNCRNLIENLLSSYVDGELDAQNARVLELHMQVCPPCTAFLRTFLATKRLARQEMLESIPPACEKAIWSYLESELQLPTAGCGCEHSEGAAKHHSRPPPESVHAKKSV
jgi:hypothetical protein